MNPAARGLLTWYARNQRSLPWRPTGSPYSVWVAEVMLQQTRAETAAPYFLRWMKRFPTLASLAGASEGDVLRSWEGLGYYRRALALRDGARQVVSDLKGRLPREPSALLQLPGIGPYSAAAIAALAFGRDEIALDGNLRRVLSRLSNLEIDPRRPEGERRLLAYAREMLPPGRAAEFNQALMDLGSLVCRPREPRLSGLSPQAMVQGAASRRRTSAPRPFQASGRAPPRRRRRGPPSRRPGSARRADRPAGSWVACGSSPEANVIRANPSRTVCAVSSRKNWVSTWPSANPSGRSITFTRTSRSSCTSMPADCAVESRRRWSTAPSAGSRRLGWAVTPWAKWRERSPPR